MIRLRALLLAASFLLAGPAAAEPIELKRGIATDTWVTWPAERDWTRALLTPYPEWRQHATTEDVVAIKAAGFDFVRLALDPAPVLSPGKPLPEAAFIAEMLLSIDKLTEAGLKVVVDLHTIPRYPDRPTGTEGYLATPEAFDAYIAFAAAVAAALAREDPGKVALEPFNEPTIDCAWDRPRTRAWPGHLARLHAAIRKVAPTITLVLQGACWGGSDGLAAIDPKSFEDENIIWSFHSYEPFLLSHQGATWTDGPERHVGGLSYPPRRSERKTTEAAAIERIRQSPATPSERRDLERRLRKALADYFAPGRAARMIETPLDVAARWARRHAIPTGRIMLGEFGVIRGVTEPGTPEAVRAAALSAMRKAAEARGFSWSAWGWGGSFGLTRSDTDRTFAPAIREALGLGGED